MTSIDETKYDLNRRSIYLPVIRNHMYDFFQLFDFPDPTIVQGNRKESSTNQQALFLMNSLFSQQIASKIAQNTYNLNKNDWINRIYTVILGRIPSEIELRTAVNFLRTFRIQLTSIMLQSHSARPCFVPTNSYTLDE